MLKFMSTEDNPRTAKIEDEVTPVFFTFTHFIYSSPKTGCIDLADIIIIIDNGPYLFHRKVQAVINQKRLS